MTLLPRIRIAAAVLASCWTGAVAAQDAPAADQSPAPAAPEAPPLQEPGPGPLGDLNNSPKVALRNKWESGLDIKYAKIIDHTTPLLSAQWLRRFSTGTHVGLTLSALPTSVDRKEEDGSKTKANSFFGGLVLEQAVWEDFPFRVVVALSGGRGRLYLRNELSGREDVFVQPDFTWFEPALYGYVYNYKHLDLGLMAGFRSVKMEKTEDYEVKDEGGLSGGTFGLSFRHVI